MLSETAGPEMIDGPGAGLVTVSGGNAVEVFSVASGVTASLTGLTISRGLASQGGGLSVDGGTVALTNVTVINNQAVGADRGGGGTGNRPARARRNSGDARNGERLWAAADLPGGRQPDAER